MNLSIGWNRVGRINGLPAGGSAWMRAMAWLIALTCLHGCSVQAQTIIDGRFVGELEGQTTVPTVSRLIAVP